MLEEYTFYDVYGDRIEIYPDELTKYPKKFGEFIPKEEKIVFLSPHDDDAILWSGYLLRYFVQEGAEVIVVILCDGSAGYYSVEDKDKIVGVRLSEALEAYTSLGVKKENIIALLYQDYTLLNNTGDAVRKLIKIFRGVRATRVVIPEKDNKHVDHFAANIIGWSAVHQANGSIMPELGESSSIKTIIVYGVSENGFRGNLMLFVLGNVEKEIVEALYKFKSQERIIKDLIEKRRYKKVVSLGRYLEKYYCYEVEI